MVATTDRAGTAESPGGRTYTQPMRPKSNRDHPFELRDDPGTGPVIEQMIASPPGKITRSRSNARH